MNHYVSFNLRVLPETYDKTLGGITEWVRNNLELNHDYQWAYAKFRYSNYADNVNFKPIGILFNDREDLLAFKLRFGL